MVRLLVRHVKWDLEFNDSDDGHIFYRSVFNQTMLKYSAFHQFDKPVIAWKLWKIRSPISFEKPTIKSFKIPKPYYLEHHKDSQSAGLTMISFLAG
jgi:hypothetical protein